MTTQVEVMMMGPASEVGGAVSNAVNCLCAFLAWLDGSASRATPFDSADLAAALLALETVAVAGPSHVGPPPISAEALAGVARLRSLISEWTSTGALPAEAATLAEQCVRALWGGVSWREIMARTMSPGLGAKMQP
jgi:hypothetical protein